MWSQSSAEQGQGHLKVIGAFITALVSNLVGPTYVRNYHTTYQYKVKGQNRSKAVFFSTVYSTSYRFSLNRHFRECAANVLLHVCWRLVQQCLWFGVVNWAGGSVVHDNNGVFKVLRVLIYCKTSILECLIRIECQTSSRSSQGHQAISRWIGLKLRTCKHNGAHNKFKVASRSSRYISGLASNFSTCDHNWGPNMSKVISRSSEYLLLD